MNQQKLTKWNKKKLKRKNVDETLKSGSKQIEVTRKNHFASISDNPFSEIGGSRSEYYLSFSVQECGAYHKSIMYHQWEIYLIRFPFQSVQECGGYHAGKLRKLPYQVSYRVFKNVDRVSCCHHAGKLRQMRVDSDQFAKESRGSRSIIIILMIIQRSVCFEENRGNQQSILKS